MVTNKRWSTHAQSTRKTKTATTRAARDYQFCWCWCCCRSILPCIWVWVDRHMCSRVDRILYRGSHFADKALKVSTLLKMSSSAHRCRPVLQCLQKTSEERFKNSVSRTKLERKPWKNWTDSAQRWATLCSMPKSLFRHAICRIGLSPLKWHLRRAVQHIVEWKFSN